MCPNLPDKAARTSIRLTLTKGQKDGLDYLVDEGIYLDRQVAIRDALRRLFQLYRIEPFGSELEEEAELEDAAPSEQ